MAITDATAARPDIDQTRTAAMGGSYGGYMANWIAGHTDRFQAIVSHAGLWALDQMFGTTDLPSYWRRLFGDPLANPERYVANSPHRHLGAIATPMLVIHGDKDYRVPVGEALRLWAELTTRPGGAAGMKFLYFPDENHWILNPGNAVVWYQAVLAFLATHLLGEPWQRPTSCRTQPRHEDPPALVTDFRPANRDETVVIMTKIRGRPDARGNESGICGDFPPGGWGHVPGGWVAVVCQGGHMTRAQLDKRPGDVAAMFDKVAPRYDLLNDVLSLGQDRWWRKVVAKAVGARAGERVLDLAAGTGTSSVTFTAEGATCVACDFSLGMLRAGMERLGAEKARARHPARQPSPARPPGTAHRGRNSPARPGALRGGRRAPAPVWR